MVLSNGAGLVLGHASLGSNVSTGYFNMGNQVGALLRPPSAQMDWLTACSTADGLTAANVYVDAPNTNVATGLVGCPTIAGGLPKF